MVADYPPGEREWREQHPEILTAGYTLAEANPERCTTWICPRCFDDFAERFGWQVVDG